MKTTNKIVLSFMAAAALSVLDARAGSTVVLESYENGFQTNSQHQVNIAPFTLYGTRNGTPCACSIYTSAGPGDPRCTDGTHSAKVVFPVDGFGNDFSISLSDAACTLIEKAASSNQVARYVLRYDIIYQDINLLSFFNQTWFFANNWDYCRSGGAILTNYGGHQFGIASFSVPLELPGIASPTNAPSPTNSGDFASAGIPGLTGFCSDQFQGVTEPLNNFTIYIDNIRLVDTYETPTATPAVFPLQSFETASPALGGVTNLTPSVTTLSLYTTNGIYNPQTDGGEPDAYTGPLDFPQDPSSSQDITDFAVTDGSNCLQVACTGPYYNYDIFTLPFQGTRLDKILSLGLSPAQLSHYTLRWDVTTPFINLNTSMADSDFFQIDYNAPTGSIFPMSTGRRQYDSQVQLQRETHQATLDQIPYWGPNPPTLGVSVSQPPSWEGAPFYFDNFELIDTAPGYTVITGETYDPSSHQLGVTWLSTPGQTYNIQFASSLTAGFTSTLATGVPSGGDSTTKVVTTPGGTAGYVRIVGH
jgi:hypothetical protein